MLHHWNVMQLQQKKIDLGFPQLKAGWVGMSFSHGVFAY